MFMKNTYVNMYIYWWRKHLYGLPSLTKPIYVLYVSVCTLLEGSDKKLQAAKKSRPDGCFHSKWQWAINIKMDP